MLGLLFALAPYLYIKHNPTTVKKDENTIPTTDKKSLEEERSFFLKIP